MRPRPLPRPNKRRQTAKRQDRPLREAPVVTVSEGMDDGQGEQAPQHVLEAHR